MIAAGLNFMIFVAIARYLGNTLHPIQTAFIRYALGLVVLAPLFLRQGLTLFKTTQLSRHALRGVMHGVGVMLWFYAVARLPITEVTALSFTAPIFVVIGALLFLGEPLSLPRVIAVLCGFIGVLVILRPGLVPIGLGALAMLVSAPLFATSKLLMKVLLKHDTIGTVVVQLSIFATLTMLIPTLWVWQTPTALEMALLCGTAVFATVSHLCMARGLQLIDVTVAQPAEFLQLVWSTLLGVFVFSEHPSAWVWLGAGIIVGSASYIARYERRIHG